ncbi:uncharacterized protein LOC120445613 isoform X2 [Drosophila santomea]|uniref:uncharacterized protein LOC120445613 isoform X2 n=1 Tax=Drosophila santomea TaxID=129105 RepID=UPI001952A322|nr:uncharacterized protein LOC120445613 isoform X2 [Drosophila santomea]
MGCNTSQELKTKDGAAIDAVSNGEPEPSAPPLEGESSKSSASNHTNHAKSSSIISNGEAKAANGGGPAGGGSGRSEATNGIDRPCDKAAITELNDDEDEGNYWHLIIYQKQQYIHNTNSQSRHKNPSRLSRPQSERNHEKIGNQNCDQQRHCRRSSSIGSSRRGSRIRGANQSRARG